MSTPHENRATTSNDVQKTPTRQRESGFFDREENSDRNSRHYQSERTMPFSSLPMALSGPQSTSSSRHYSHLPTPQSPKNAGSYLGAAPRTPESPIHTGSQSTYTPLTAPQLSHRTAPPQHDARTAYPLLQTHSLSRSQQILTPESSPVHERYISRNTSLASLNSTPPAGISKSSMSSLGPAPTLVPSSVTATPARSTLSSPFMAKASVADRTPKQHTPSSTSRQSAPVHVPDVFFAQPTPAPNSSLEPFATAPSSEIDRIRQETVDDNLTRLRQAENRRPDYLKRTKRSLNDTEQPFDPVLDFDDREGPYSGVGIMESPMKGRRLNLFQETSEESFEESLMTGGYERYRNANADWIHQPSPMPIALAEVEPVLTEKEAKKQRRLAAFGDLSSGVPPPSKLLPVDLDGRGRVLLDPRQETLSTQDFSPSKKKTPRRKKKSPEAPDLTPAPERLYVGTLPDWPDAQFPWSLRLEEQTSKLRATQEERLKWIEKFLDRDSDEEDEPEDEEILPSTMWGQVYEDAPMPSRRGRGKMIGLPASPGDGTRASMPGASRRRAFFPSDPADAKAALLSKRSVRMLSYRTQLRIMGGRAKTWEEDSDDDETCFCGGKHSGELVQCDACETWYHLGCIGVKSIKELGKEDDSWFCAKCVPPRTPSPELMAHSSEPTFVPTDERRTTTPSEFLFYQSLPFPASPASPWHSSRPPNTPVRGESRATFSSGSPVMGPGTHDTSSPPLSSRSVRVYTPAHESLGSDEAGFDPTSTPSRGITFGAPFATPKTALWSSRANGMFQTPLRAFEPSNRSHTGGLIESGGTPPSFSPYRHQAAYDESPVPRPVDPSRDGPKTSLSRRLLESPAFRIPYAHLPESPAMRSKPSGRQDTSDTAYMEGRGLGRPPTGPTSAGSAH